MKMDWFPRSDAPPMLQPLGAPLALTLKVKVQLLCVVKMGFAAATFDTKCASSDFLLSVDVVTFISRDNSLATHCGANLNGCS